MKKLLTALAGVGVALTMSSAAKAECGDVSVASMNWASAELMSEVDKFILEEGYGCSVEIVAGDTMPTFTSMNEKGQPDVAGELWTNAVAEPLDAAVGEGRLHKVNNGPITQLGEGWWVTPAFAEAHPDLIKDIDALLARPDLFPDQEDPSKGAFVGCPAGWGCQLANANLYRGFDMEAKGWVLVDPGSAAGLDASMAKAADRGEFWLGYYWSPTALIGKFGMVPVDMGPWAGKDNWDSCIVKAEQDCADPKASSWTESSVSTVVTDEFKQRGGVAIDYFAKRVFPGPVMNGMLVYMNENQASGEDATIEFLMNHEDVWTTWVTADAAAKIKAAL